MSEYIGCGIPPSFPHKLFAVSAIWSEMVQIKAISLTAALLCLASQAAGTCNNAETTQPNIIFVLADDLGWGDVSFHGYNQTPTPFIDERAAEGVILNQHYSQYLCTPSRVALMSGRYPYKLRMQHLVMIRGEDRSIPTNIKIMPAYMKDLGYATHMIGKWHLGDAREEYTPARRGFDTFFGYYSGGTDYWQYTVAQGALANQGFDLKESTRETIDPNQYKYQGRYATHVFQEKANDIIHYHDKRQPLFMYLSYPAPHAGTNFSDGVQAPQDYIDRFPHIASYERRKYAAMIAALDDAMRDLWHALEKRDMLNNTVIVFSADNGGQNPENSLFFPNPVNQGVNYPLRGAKFTAWEGGVRASSFVWSPLLKHPARISTELYHFTDWLPTFYGLGGGKRCSLPAELDGFDIWASISRDKKSPREDAVIHLDSTPGFQEYAIRWRQWKLVVGSAVNMNYSLDHWYVPSDGLNASYIIDVPAAVHCNATAKSILCDANAAPCLFNIDDDPCERRNLAGIRLDILEKMMDKLNAYNSTAPPYLDPLTTYKYPQAASYGGPILSFLPDLGILPPLTCSL